VYRLSGAEQIGSQQPVPLPRIDDLFRSAPRIKLFHEDRLEVGIPSTQCSGGVRAQYDFSNSLWLLLDRDNAIQSY